MLYHPKGNQANNLIQPKFLKTVAADYSLL